MSGDRSKQAPPPTGADGAAPSREIEPPRRLSESALWELQRRFFEQQGVDAWRRGRVPHYVTSNPFIARRYAKVALAYLRDAAARGPLDCAHIIELGAGSGRFSYHFIRQFFELLDESRLAGIRVTYIMTDLARSNLEFWRAQDLFRPFIASGRLDFALFDAETSREVALVERGETLAEGRASGPMILLANYVFDGIRQDLFHCERGSLFEVDIGLRASPDQPISEADPFTHLSLELERRPASLDVYDDLRYRRLLEHYRSRVAAGAILLPTGALRCLERVRRIAGGQLLTLSADRGCAPGGAFHLGRGLPMAVHGSFSLPVNYDAIGRWAIDVGGLALHCRADDKIHIAALLFDDRLEHFGETCASFREAIEGFGPGGHFVLKRSLHRLAAELRPEEMLAHLALSEWDARVLWLLLPHLVKVVARCSQSLQERWREAIDRVWDIHYPIGEQDDLAFHLGILAAEMGSWRQAAVFYGRSIALHGADANTLFNQAVAHIRLGEAAEALACADRALALRPDHEDAQKLRDRITGGGAT